MLHQGIPSHIESNEQGIIFWARNEVQRYLIEESGMPEIAWVEKFAADYAEAATKPEVQHLFLEKKLEEAKQEILKKYPQFRIGTIH
mgnify:CR=1 FL=1